MKLLCLIMLLISHPCFALYISDNGAWVGNDADKEHAFDASLASGFIEFLKNENAQSAVDFGCGLGDYVKTLLAAGIITDGFDGNPFTNKLSGGVANTLDLSIPFDLNKKYDWVISIEVGEHLPEQYETIFIKNLIKHTKDGMILSWAIEGQPGYGHFNCRNNDYIKNRMAKYGFYNDLPAENFLRNKASLCWFKHTIMVFRKDAKKVWKN